MNLDETADDILRELVAEFGGRLLVDRTGYLVQLDHKDADTLADIVNRAGLYLEKQKK